MGLGVYLVRFCWLPGGAVAGAVAGAGFSHNHEWIFDPGVAVKAAVITAKIMAARI